MSTSAGFLGVRSYDNPHSSKFFVPPSNSLGLDAMKARNTLKIFALTKPEAYTALRQEVFDALVTDMVTSHHMMLFNLLSQGKYGDKQIQLGNTNWGPHLPDKQVAALSEQLASTIHEIFVKEVFPLVMPDSFAELTDRKMGMVSVPSAAGAAAVEAINTPQASSSSSV